MRIRVGLFSIHKSAQCLVKREGTIVRATPQSQSAEVIGHTWLWPENLPRDYEIQENALPKDKTEVLMTPLGFPNTAENEG